MHGADGRFSLESESTSTKSFERFWCSRGGAYNLDGHGFLPDPDATLFGEQSLNPGVLRTGDLSVCRCLVLLGEPGAGKSTAVADTARLVATGVPVVSFDLAAYGSEDRLVREVFEHPTVTAWADGTGELCLVLDSLDEVRARVPHVGGVIADRVRGLPCDRLFLRIACRTADWPAGLEQSLEEVFDTPKVVEILPLRRKDAAAIAATWCDPARFLDEVEKAGAGPLAARPLTLRFLARAFGESGKLPARGAALYATGIRALCEEQNTGRRDAGHSGTLSLDERIAVARRIAAATIFGGVPSLWTGPEVDASSDAIPLGRICGSAEPIPGGTVAVTLPSVKEATQTGLFTSRGSQRLGWAHATFADFLAADWVVANDLSPAQASPLFLGPDGRCWPQTRLAAAWAVAIAAERFGFLAKADPAAFNGEVELPGDDLRAAVIDGLFSVAASLTVAPWNRRYHALRHPNIADQIRRHLSDPDPERRRLAYELAGEFAAVELLDDLAAIAMDVTAETGDRVAAGWVLARLADPDRTMSLRTLALDPAARGDDPADDLKGVALRASWPHAMSTAEVFSVLTRRRRVNYIGSYASFIDHFRAGLTEADIDAGLRWLLKDLNGPVGDHNTAALANRVLELAATRPADPSVVNAFARVVLARVGHNQGLLYDDLRGGWRGDPLADPALRRSVAAAVLASDPSARVYHRLSWASPYSLGVVRSEDLGWLADQYEAADGELRTALLALVSRTFDPRVAEHRNLILDMPRGHPLHADFAHEWVDPVTLDSPEADQMRQYSQASCGPESADSNGDDGINGQIEELLDRFDNGDAVGFRQSTLLLTDAPGSKHFGATFDPDIASMGRWSTLGGKLRERIVDAAERYLRSQPCQPEQWLDKPETRHFPSEAGYKAMVLLLREAPERLHQLPASVWVEWAPVLVSQPTASIDGASWEDKVGLFELSGPDALDAARCALVTRVSAAVSNGQRPFAEMEAGYLWNDYIASVYLSLARKASAEPRAELVGTLVEHDFELVRPLLLGWLEDEPDLDRRRLAARQLLDADLDRSWATLKEVLGTDLTLAEQVLARSRMVIGLEGVDHVSTPVLADIYRWLRLKFPPEPDPQFDNAHTVGPRERIGQWRDNLLMHLRDRGTPEAVDAIRTIAKALPSDRWLARTRATAEAALRRDQWTPTPLSQLLTLAADHHKVLVNDSASLAAAVAGALEKIQARLTGATPESHYLWDTRAGRPKSEDEISDYLLNKLNDSLGASGVIVNREVQIRRTKPSGIGERADLLIEASPVGDPGTRRLSLPVEVKGAWNDDLRTAIRDQLVNRYMRDTAATHGTYIVAWPDLKSWKDKTDNRRNKVAKVDRETIEADLARLAASFAEGGVTVSVVHLDISYSRPT